MKDDGQFWRVREFGRRWTGFVLGGVFLLVVAAGDGAAQSFPQTGKPLEQMSLEELQQLWDASLAQEQALVEAIKQERGHVQWYLLFADQILQMQRFLGEDGGRDPGQTLVATRQQLYHQSFSAQDWSTLIANHQAVTERYFQRVGQWAANNPAFVQQLQAAWQQYAWKIAQGQDVTNELLTANQVLAWASGYQNITPALDHFQGTSQRVAAALTVTDQQPSPAPATVSARPLIVENRTPQVLQLSLFQPGNFTGPYLTYALQPGQVELTNTDRTALSVTPEWGIAAQMADRSSSWPVRAIKDCPHIVDAAGRYSMSFGLP